MFHLDFNDLLLIDEVNLLVKILKNVCLYKYFQSYGALTWLYDASYKYQRNNRTHTFVYESNEDLSYTVL
jgi:hypothetical protein